MVAAEMFTLLFVGAYGECLSGDEGGEAASVGCCVCTKTSVNGGGRSGEQDDEVADRCGQVEVSGKTCPSRQVDKPGGDVANFSTTHRQNIKPSPGVSVATGADLPSKGKEIIVYNPFAVLESDEFGEGGEFGEDRFQMEESHSTGPMSNPPSFPHDHSCVLECVWAQLYCASTRGRPTGS
ncbi:UNVERIFIED_CONTAM: hypothetical protein Sradi_7064400 [Sesamum radiatum]|uniref:Uncharacterized protein n=1 Tax=Sesamum radiatum TaxID=300843 RepID=A0AAW2J752_SESRA